MNIADTVSFSTDGRMGDNRTETVNQAGIAESRTRRDSDCNRLIVLSPTGLRSRDALHTVVGLTASILAFTWPQLSPLVRGEAASYLFVTVAFTLLIVATIVTWHRDDEASPCPMLRVNSAVPVVGFVAAAVLVSATYRWTGVVAWQPYGADMLIVIREATHRFLHGHTPYAIYRSYDAPWNMAMPYGPALWGPFLVPQLLRVDFRVVTIAGELFVPVWCGAAAVVEAARGRMAAAAAWLAVMAAIVLAFDVQQFTVIGHTPVYWPFLPLLAVMATRGRWSAAACVLGVLVIARTTMIALTPVFLMAVWRVDRRSFRRVLIVLTATIAAGLVPFAVWDRVAIWDSMVLSYPRVMKAAVWPVLRRSGIETIGSTEWLLERGRDSLVVPVQVIAMIVTYAAAWWAIRRGLRPLPWMALALLAFSLTTLYPVHYLYYDVVLLLVSAAMVETLDAGPIRMAVRPWLLSLATVVVLVFAAIRTMISPFPSVAVGDAPAGRSLHSGFGPSESDGQSRFAWIVGREARIALPRSSTTAATVVLIARSPFGRDHPPQTVTAILNGQMLAHTTISDAWQEIRFAAPRSVWWIGFNDLRLVFASTVSPREIGAGDDPRQLAAAISRVGVTPLKE